MFPRNGLVGGPGGKCESRLPHAESLKNTKSTGIAIKRTAFMVIVFLVAVGRRAGRWQEMPDA